MHVKLSIQFARMPTLGIVRWNCFFDANLFRAGVSIRSLTVQIWFNSSFFRCRHIRSWCEQRRTLWSSWLSKIVCQLVSKDAEKVSFEFPMFPCYNFCLFFNQCSRALVCDQNQLWGSIASDKSALRCLAMGLDLSHGSRFRRFQALLMGMPLILRSIPSAGEWFEVFQDVPFLNLFLF